MSIVVGKREALHFASGLSAQASHIHTLYITFICNIYYAGPIQRADEAKLWRQKRGGPYRFRLYGPPPTL